MVKAFKNGIAWSVDLITWWTQAVTFERIVIYTVHLRWLHLLHKANDIFFDVIVTNEKEEQNPFSQIYYFLFQLLCTFTDKVHICLEDKNMYVWTLLSTTDCICTCTCNYFHWRSTYSVIVWVRVHVVLKRTVVGDWQFDHLSGSHLESQMNSVCQSV